MSERVCTDGRVSDEIRERVPDCGAGNWEGPTAISVEPVARYCKQLTVGGTQVLPSVDTGGRNAVVRQVRRCAAVQTPVNCHQSKGQADDAVMTINYIVHSHQTANKPVVRRLTRNLAVDQVVVQSPSCHHHHCHRLLLLLVLHPQYQQPPLADRISSPSVAGVPGPDTGRVPPPAHGSPPVSAVPEHESTGNCVTLCTPVCTVFDAAVDAILTRVGEWWRHWLNDPVWGFTLCADESWSLV